MKRFADGHIHFYDYDFKNSKRALDAMASLGVTDSAVHSLSAYPGGGIGQNLFALNFKAMYEGEIKLRVFGSFHELDAYSEVPYEKQLDELLLLGCEGIKFIHMKPNARKAIGKGLNDASYEKALSIMEERGTPVVIHTGDPVRFWDAEKIDQNAISQGWFYGDGSFMPYEQYYKEDFEMLNNHPRLNVTFAHFMFLADNYDEAVSVMESFPNLKLDLTPAWEIYVDFAEKIDKWKSFFEKYSDRIIFGTDSSDRRSDEGIKRTTDMVYNFLTNSAKAYPEPGCGGRMIRGLDLSEEIIKKITYSNFSKFVGEEIPTVDTERLKFYAEKTYSLILNNASEDKSAIWLKSIIEK